MDDKEIRALQKRLTVMKGIEHNAWDMANRVPRDTEAMEDMAAAVRTVIRLAHAEQVRLAELLGDNMLKDVRQEGGE